MSPLVVQPTALSRPNSAPFHRWGNRGTGTPRHLHRSCGLQVAESGLQTPAAGPTAGTLHPGAGLPAAPRARGTGFGHGTGVSRLSSACRQEEGHRDAGAGGGLPGGRGWPPAMWMAHRLVKPSEMQSSHSRQIERALQTPFPPRQLESSSISAAAESEKPTDAKVLFLEFKRMCLFSTIT